MPSYRKIWEDANGPIPKDELGRSYEIHHIDGNRKNNDLSNLMCVSIREHYEIHLKQKDYGAAFIISQRLDVSAEEMQRLAKLAGESQRGKIPWSKGKTGVFSEETLKRISDSVKKLYENDPTKKEKKLVDLRRGLEKAKALNPDLFRKYKEENPFYGKKHSEETKLKLKRAWEERKDRTPWNKGLTKETDERVKNYSEKLSITNKKK